MIKANDLSQFTFRKIGSGEYRVSYQTEYRGDYWINDINDMTIIDATKNADWAKVGDIKRLRDMVKQGAHYSSMGERIDKNYNI